MTVREPTRGAGHRLRWAVLAGLLVVSAAAVGVVDHQLSAAPAASPVSPVSPVSPSSPVVARPIAPTHVSLPVPVPGPAGEADGVVPAAVTVFDDSYPAVTRLNPALLDTLRRAARDAGRVGISFYVNSGWRSAKYQEQLLQEAISKYGSEREAARWVATPSTSAHVSGNAVDLGRSDATAWLSRHGAAYGLCQIYRNEPWHYELRPQASSDGCPPMYADPTQDPRMQE